MKLTIDTDDELNAEQLYGLYVAAKKKEDEYVWVIKSYNDGNKKGYKEGYEKVKSELHDDLTKSIHSAYNDGYNLGYDKGYTSIKSEIAELKTRLKNFIYLLEKV